MFNQCSNSFLCDILSWLQQPSRTVFFLHFLQILCGTFRSERSDFIVRAVWVCRRNQILLPFFLFFGTSALFIDKICSSVTEAKRGTILFFYVCSEVNRTCYSSPTPSYPIRMRRKDYSLVWYMRYKRNLRQTDLPHTGCEGFLHRWNWHSVLRALTTTYQRRTPSLCITTFSVNLPSISHPGTKPGRRQRQRERHETIG